MPDIKCASSPAWCWTSKTTVQRHSNQRILFDNLLPALSYRLQDTTLQSIPNVIYTLTNTVCRRDLASHTLPDEQEGYSDVPQSSDKMTFCELDIAPQVVSSNSFAHSEHYLRTTRFVVKNIEVLCHPDCLAICSRQACQRIQTLLPTLIHNVANFR